MDFFDHIALRRRPLIFVLTLVFAWSCSDSDNYPEVCTLVGCSNVLIVQLEGTIPTSFKLKAVGAGDPPVIVESTELALVESNIYLEGFTPEQVTIQISFDSDSISETFYTVFYEAYQPNGPTCGPTCLEATVTVVL